MTKPEPCWNRLELVDMNFNIGFKSKFQELVTSLSIRHAPTKKLSRCQVGTPQIASWNKRVSKH